MVKRAPAVVRAVAAAGMAALAAAIPSFALAHAHLARSVPAVDSTVRKAPGRVELSFTERLESGLTVVTVKDGQGRRVDRGDVRVLPGNGRQVAVDLEPLPAGTYTVDWAITSVDTHRTSGSFKFSVKP